MRFKGLFFIAFFTLFQTLVFSQGVTFDPDGSAEETEPAEIEEVETTAKFSRKKETESIDSLNLERLYNRVMIIPYEPRMYFSEVDRNIAKKNELNYTQINGRFRDIILASIMSEIDETYRNPVTLWNTTNEERLKDLDYVYQHISYSYEVFDTTAILKKNRDKSQSKKYAPAKKIVNGQLVAPTDNSVKYMNAVFKNKEVLSYLTKKYETDLYVFINELDIKNDLSDLYSISNDNYKREIKIHYTIMDGNGNHIYGGLAGHTFHSEQNDMYEIVRLCFPSISSQLASNLPGRKLLSNK
jgi:hypothetical protein